MGNSQKYLIMFIGKTHSGKTTFANEFKKENGNILVLEADPIAVFIKEHFPELINADNNKHYEIFGEVSLKYKIFLLLLESALSLGKPIILSNSNMWLKGRQLVSNLCKRLNYKLVGIYFDFPEELLFERVKIYKRPFSILRVSKNFNDLIINQRTRMQVPDPLEFDIFYAIKSPEDLLIIKQKLVSIL